MKINSLFAILNGLFRKTNSLFIFFFDIAKVQNKAVPRK